MTIDANNNDRVRYNHALDAQQAAYDKLLQLALIIGQNPEGGKPSTRGTPKPGQTPKLGATPKPKSKKDLEALWAQTYGPANASEANPKLVALAVVIEYYGGAASRVGVSETAFAQRQAQYNVLILGQWVDPRESQRHIEWVRGLADSMRPFSSSAYFLNYLGEEGEDTIKAALGPNYDRLMAVKKKYDPENFFCLNQNIKPEV
jgi:hypothetical protein